MALVVRRKVEENETWRDCVKRYAVPYGLETTALRSFDEMFQAAGPDADQGVLAWGALYEWDLLDFEDPDALTSAPLSPKPCAVTEKEETPR